MEEEPDFFKPHPHPTKARVKNSMFNMVPDAFTEKTLTLTGDIRRVKQKPVNGGEEEEEEGGVFPLGLAAGQTTTPEDQPREEAEGERVGEEGEGEGEKTPVQESMVAETHHVMEAHPWDHPDAVSRFFF